MIEQVRARDRDVTGLPVNVTASTILRYLPVTTVVAVAAEGTSPLAVGPVLTLAATVAPTPVGGRQVGVVEVVDPLDRPEVSTLLTH